MKSWEEQIISGLPPSDKCLLAAICRNMVSSSSSWVSILDLKTEYDKLQQEFPDEYPAWNYSKIKMQIKALTDFSYLKVKGKKSSTFRITINDDILHCDVVLATIVPIR